MRRVVSFLGMLAVLALALMLLWQVYLHHEATVPYNRDETTLASGKNFNPRELNHTEIGGKGIWHV